MKERILGYFQRKREKKNQYKAEMAKLGPMRRVWIEWIKPVGTVVITLTIVRSAFADWNDVPTGSMKPTILEGDRIYVNKVAYGLRAPLTMRWIARWDTPDRSDIVVCFSPEDGTRLVKRVVGIPGDTLEIRQGLVYVNGTRCNYEPVDQTDADALLEGIEHADIRFVQEETLKDAEPHAVMHFTKPGKFAARDFAPVVVPERQYFLMGDNRDESGDSRSFGFVKESKIVGRSGAIAFSVDPENYYLPRWGRFLKSLP